MSEQQIAEPYIVMNFVKHNSVNIAVLVKALANTHRLRIIYALYQQEKSVGALEAITLLSQSALSQHLARLGTAGVVGTRREQQTIYYSLSAQAKKIISGLAEINPAA
jgi:DNA-binding transcriptional ArsR family regulator